MQQTLVLLKPDTIQRHLVGEIISRLERKGLNIIAMKMMNVTVELARKHYVDHVEKPFYPGLEKYITSGPVIVMMVSGPEAIAVLRLLAGATNGIIAQPGTIRGDYSLSPQQNLVHASDSEESAAREIGIFFSQNEMCCK